MLNLEYLANLLDKNQTAAGAQVKEFSIDGKHFPFNPAQVLWG